jgi:hypothetical protein
LVSPEKPEYAIKDQNDAQDDFRFGIQGDLFRGGQQDIDPKGRVHQGHEEIKILQEFLGMGFGWPVIRVTYHKIKAIGYERPVNKKTETCARFFY